MRDRCPPLGDTLSGVQNESYFFAYAWQNLAGIADVFVTSSTYARTIWKNKEESLPTSVASCPLGWRMRIWSEDSSCGWPVCTYPIPESDPAVVYDPEL